MDNLFNDKINFNCFNCIYSRIDNNHISCIKDNISNWVDCPYKCEKEIDKYTKEFLNLNKEEMETLINLMEDINND